MTKYADFFTAEVFLKENHLLAYMLSLETSLKSARKSLWEWIDRTQFRQYSEESRLRLHPLELVVVRDCYKSKRRRHVFFQVSTAPMRPFTTYHG